MATYYNVPEDNYFDRKADAVKAVAALRESGNEAYLVHGHNESRIYIGCVPYSATLPGVKRAQSIKNLTRQYQLSLGKYKFRAENGAKVTSIVHDTAGHERRIPRIPHLVTVDDLRHELAY